MSAHFVGNAIEQSTQETPHDFISDRSMDCIRASGAACCGPIEREDEVSRDELIIKMMDAFDRKWAEMQQVSFSDSARSNCFGAALDVAIAELLKPAGMVENGSPMCGSCAERTTTLILASRRSRYLKPVDAAVEAVNNLYERDPIPGGRIGIFRSAQEIVAAVRAADKSLA